MREPGPGDRIDVVDVLRGIALLGMFLVHFNDASSAGSGIAGEYQRIVALLFELRFATIFAILFGVGFAIQLRRADAHGESFLPRYLRRIFGLAAFGLIAQAAFGRTTLIDLAVWGLPLLVVRKWSTPILIGAVVLSAASGEIYVLARTTYGVAAWGEQGFRAKQEARVTQNRDFNRANYAARHAKEYSTVLVGRLRHLWWLRTRPLHFLPADVFTMFLLGVLGLRLGLFERPDEHRRMIAALMLIGVASWALSAWVLAPPNTKIGSLVGLDLVVARLRSGFGVVSRRWLALAYIGGVLLLVAHNPLWLRRLAAFAWTGRMALTNYFVQVAILDLTFSRYALGLSVTPLVGMGAALVLFLAQAALGRWWLTRFRYGPLEWIWRSITYARWAQWRADPAVHRP